MANKIKSGGGSTSNKFVNVGVRSGQPKEAINKTAVSQIGRMLGNHATNVKGALPFNPEPLVGRQMPSVPLGNQVALNVGKGAPGSGRVVYGQSGSQSQTPMARPMPQGRDTLKEFGADVLGKGRSPR
jgi:hypothetical protein